MTAAESVSILARPGHDRLRLTRSGSTSGTGSVWAVALLAGVVDPHVPAPGAPFDGQARVVVEASPPDLGFPHNLGLARQLPDLRFGEVFALPEAAGFSVPYGIASADGMVRVGERQEPRLSRVWERFLESFGPLPWRDVRIISVEDLNPVALSLPGAVFVHADLLRRQPHRAHFLYLVHELLHQWFGNLVRFGGRNAAWEAGVDVVTRHTVEETVSRSLGPVFDRLGQRYLASGVPELVARARLGTSSLEEIRAHGLTRWARLAEAGRAAVRTHHERLAALPPGSNTQTTGE